MITETITLAGGCFWCTEAIFQRLNGVTKVTSGYSGGDVENPSYEEVSSGKSGHAEAIQIEFDPKVISFTDILEVFFKTHDSTTLNQQGSDVGPQYRSAIFYQNEEQKKIAERMKGDIPGSVTEVVPFKNFYEAEDYHKNYYNENRGAMYCKLVIDPKIKKLTQKFEAKLKKN